jgi:hypothetical protein
VKVNASMKHSVMATDLKWGKIQSNRKYSETYLKFEFTSKGDVDKSCLQCLICVKIFYKIN